MKTVGHWRKSRFQGRARTEYGFRLTLAAYNLARMPQLLAAKRARWRGTRAKVPSVAP